MRSYRRYRRFRHHTGGVSYTPTQLAGIYGFPQGTTGKGKRAAVIELGGGYVQSDLDGYFHSLGLSVKPVVFHPIQGATNTPEGPDGADGEVMLDLCVIGGMAPGCELHCYTAPNTDAGFMAAIDQAITDKMDGISISWGAAEDQYDPAVIHQYDALFQKAAQASITVASAAGDNGSTDGEIGNHVDFPASSPWVLSCGGTSLQSTSPLVEVVWNDGTNGGATGGGVSSIFPLPAYQSLANVPGGRFRGVPDVAGNADPDTGWAIVIDGQAYVLGGTSAVAPMWTALCLRLSEALGHNVGHIGEALYRLSGWQRDILSGNNGTYNARPGYDCNTGLGVPIGYLLLKLLGPQPVPAPPPPAPKPPAPPTPPKTRTIVVQGAASVTIDGKPV